MRVLVVAAHPDDEVLGCGATMASLARQKHAVSVLILGEGSTSRYSRRDAANPRKVKALSEAARRAARVLGVSQLTVKQLPDNRFDAVPLLEIVKIVESSVKKFKPEVVYTHHAGDLNIDHAITHRAVLTATRPQLGNPVREVYTFEVPSATDWAFQQLGPGFRPTVFMDVSASLKLKLRAFKEYRGEVRRFPHPRSLKALQANAVRWGAIAGVGAAEAFELVRAIR